MSGRTATRQAVADMARSLGLVLGIVAVLLLIGPARTLVFPGSDEQGPVDYDRQVAGFAKLAHTDALVPVSLPAGWRANAADLSTDRRTGTRLHIGWATPGDLFAGLDETDGDADALVRSVLGRRGTTVVGTRSLDGHEWQQRRSQRGELALTRSFGPVSVVVTGSATDEQLELLARSLR